MACDVEKIFPTDVVPFRPNLVEMRAMLLAVDGALVWTGLNWLSPNHFREWSKDLTLKMLDDTERGQLTAERMLDAYGKGGK